MLCAEQDAIVRITIVRTGGLIYRKRSRGRAAGARDDAGDFRLVDLAMGFP